jgi:hypothetical protein
MNESASSPNQRSELQPLGPSDCASEPPFATGSGAGPIRVGGVLSPADYFRAMRMFRTRRQIASVGTLYLAVLLIAVVMGENRSGRAPLRDHLYNAIGPIVVATASFAGVLAVLSVRRRLKIRSLWRAQRNPFTPCEILITNEGITLSRRDSTVSHQWSAFTACKCSEHLVLLNSDPPTSGGVVPRAFFTNDAEWARFVRIVEANVPKTSANRCRV